jgi:hypothetical protein
MAPTPWHSQFLRRRPQADEAISDGPRAEIAAPAVGWLAMTCETSAAISSYAHETVQKGFSLCGQREEIYSEGVYIYVGLRSPEKVAF